MLKLWQEYYLQNFLFNFIIYPTFSYKSYITNEKVGSLLKKNYSYIFKKKLDENLGVYFIITLFFAIGLAAGAFTIKGIDESQKEELVVYFNRFLQVIKGEKVDNYLILCQSLKNNFQTVLLIWFFGITIIGIFATLLVVSFRGFIMGFTVAFLVQGMGFKGVLTTLLAIIPQNIIYIPSILIIASQSMNFSLNIIKSKNMGIHENNFKKNILRYSSIIAITYFIMCIGSLIEAYISPAIIKAMSTYLTSQ